MKLLKKGDTIGLAATARFIKPSELSFFIKWLESKELKVKFADNLLEQHHQFAGNDEQRAESFQKLIHNENIQAIWVVRGGYGTTRILDYIDGSLLKNNPKWIIGFSDITILHLYLASLGIPSIHGDMPSRFDKVNKENFEFIYQILTTGEIEYCIKTQSLQKLELNGKIIGGNLSLIAHSIGNPNIDFGMDFLLFLEDLEEYYYHIDRMAYQLKHHGIFKKAKGILLGSFTDLKDNEIPFGYTVEQIIQNLTHQPILQNIPMGHSKQNLPFIHGHDISISQNQEKIILKQKVIL